MAVLKSTFLFLLLSSLAAASIFRHRPEYLECVDTQDCSGYECCVFTGRGLYSMPKCVPLREMWARCNSDDIGQAQNLTKHYPVGSVTFTNVYMDLCPCEMGLVCDRSENSCVDPLAREDYNDFPAHFELED